MSSELIAALKFSVAENFFCKPLLCTVTSAQVTGWVDEVKQHLWNFWFRGRSKGRYGVWRVVPLLFNLVLCFQPCKNMNYAGNSMGNSLQYMSIASCNLWKEAGIDLDQGQYLVDTHRMNRPRSLVSSANGRMMWRIAPTIFTMRCYGSKVLLFGNAGNRNFNPAIILLGC